MRPTTDALPRAAAESHQVSGLRMFLRIARPIVASPWRFMLAVLLGVVMVAANIGLLGMAAYLIAAAALRPLLVLLTLPIYIVQFSGIARAFARYTERLTGHDLTFRVLARLRSQVFEHLARLAPGQVGASRSGDLLARLGADVDELQHVYLRVVGPFLVAALVTLLSAGIFSLFSPLLAWAIVVFLLLAGVGLPLLVARLSRGLGKRQLEARAQLHTQVAESIQGVQDVLAFGLEATAQEQVAANDAMLARIQWRMAIIGALEVGLADLLASVAVWTVLLLAIPLVTTHQIGGIFLAFLALMALASFEAVEPLGAGFRFLGHALAAGQRVFAVLDSVPLITDPAEPAMGKSAPQPSTRGKPQGKARGKARRHATQAKPPALAFEDVSFAYAPHEKPALAEVSFTVPVGSRIAVVGPSGAGKTTLAQLAVRFADPISGTIRLAGTDIRRYTLADVHAHIGVVTQDAYLFNDTLRRNLLLGRPDATDAELRHALAAAQLSDMLARLPNGLDTYIGEQGQRLSGGERQRLAVARVLLHDAPLLILDEPTANLDPTTERTLLRAIETAMHGRTTLLITHRLCDMERMNTILVLDQGRIVERGTHAQLLQADGLYRRLFAIQNNMLATVPDRGGQAATLDASARLAVRMEAPHG
jgi:ATP-binding cassette subfamily C protein CydC